MVIKLPILRVRIQFLIDSGELSPWEEKVFTEWLNLSFGSPRQNEVLDIAGHRIFGQLTWDDFTQGLSPTPLCID